MPSLDFGHGDQGAAGAVDRGGRCRRRGRGGVAGCGAVHVVSCLPVPMMHLPGASTRCDIVTDGLPATWTALTVPGTAPDGGLVVEISKGIRTDLPPFPPPG